MIAETAAEIVKKIGALLLLGREETRNRNLLATFGLFHTDFAKSIVVSYNAEGMRVSCAPFAGSCTCNEDPKFPKTHRIPNDPDFHSSKCDVYRNYALAIHECLNDVAYGKDEKGQEIICFDFFWPRTLTVKMRNVLVTSFPELQSDSLWANFVSGWSKIMKFLPEPPTPWSQRGEVGAEPPEPEAQTKVSNAPTAMSFDDDLDFGAGESLQPDPATAAPAPVADPEAKAPGKPRGRKKKEAPEKNPVKEEAAPKVVEVEVEANPSEGERPSVVTLEVESVTPEKAPQEQPEKVQAPEAGPTSEDKSGAQEDPKKKGRNKKKDEQSETKKIDPIREAFGKLIREELSGISNALDFILDANGFPTEAVKNLKVRFDRLALKTAHLVYRGRHENDDNGAINPMVEVTLANVSGIVSGAVRDLGLAPEKANSWVDFKKEIKAAVDMADSMAEVMSQMGMADVVQPPPKLRDGQGNVLVP